MKKVLSIILALLLVFSVTACGNNSAQDGTGDDKDASGGTYTITYVNTSNEETGQYVGAKAFKEYVEKESDGRITVRLLFNGTMGTDREEIESVQLGNAIMTSVGNTQWSNFVKDLTALDCPFLFRTADDVYGLFEDESFYAAVDESFHAAGFKYLGMTFQGFRTLTANKEIRTMKDLSGLNIRVIEAATPMNLWKSLGASPTPLAFTEVYTALQQGTVDAQENPMEFVYSQRFYEQQEYIIMTNHQIQPEHVAMNLDFYNSLPDDLRAVVDEGAKVLIDATRAYTEEKESEYEQEILTYGCEFIELDSAVLDEMYKATQSVRDTIAEEYPTLYAPMMKALGLAG